MDKRHVRQAAADDFMQSLEHLDELLGGTMETVLLTEEAQPSATDRTQTSSVKTSHPKPTLKKTSAER
ncbi:hypothetical protein [Leptothoe sp. PORK10 BA2]|uniref:hypothetical protein n=1 Tax=Leptothoe sp. PORK10 BA2 TaxID=3110254 RepID=UPI002B2200AB|nr:hypothetical protein [Leptothoe sp. PORK10 BA2]MEA5463967.1 hypothetical protein [Leptothoe sp. PORK10 BA2]